ncbi:MAG: FIG00003370: Multicopper polyphenol oxidase [uncultured Nocardioidaceae bacterium]|uniref:Purine nucleoside phosphorylase n=1 Tax=uncultured Nocardioidaceae bacterium TaxID=253824 RepID=A0A6J4LH35_9ACTN|nr:MAG: FIG00003370: Multicopper polyphenol oxidase [uncultured Nocardioidaceae bacterium]
MFAFRDTRAAISVAFTDRHGGVSGGPYASLNLGGRSDDPEAVEANLAILARAVSVDGRPPPRLVRVRQVHGAEVLLVDDEFLGSGEASSVEADALVSDRREVALMVRAADCVPVLLADAEAGVVGAAHAGRPGMVAGVVPNTIREMRALGAQRLVAWIGPHVCGACYEVPEQMRAEVAAAVPESYAHTSWGSPSVDLGSGVRAQLEREGVAVVDAARCTMQDENLFSYRRQGAWSGRMAGLVWVRG